VIVLVGTYKLVGKQTVADTVDAALAAGYRLIGMLKYFSIMSVITRVILVCEQVNYYKQ